jgi:hypothetical protein
MDKRKTALCICSCALDSGAPSLPPFSQVQAAADLACGLRQVRRAARREPARGESHLVYLINISKENFLAGKNKHLPKIKQ